MTPFNRGTNPRLKRIKPVLTQDRNGFKHVAINFFKKHATILTTLKTASDVNQSPDFFFFNFVVKLLQQKSNQRFFFLTKKLSFSLLSAHVEEYGNLIQFLSLKLQKFQTKIGRGFFLTEFFECVILFLTFKDAEFFGQ